MPQTSIPGVKAPHPEVVRFRPVTLVSRAATGHTAALYASPADALAQAVHDAFLPGQADPLGIYDGEIEHTSENGTPLDLADFKSSLLVGPKDLKAAPECGCDFCDRHRSGLTQVGEALKHWAHERTFSEREVELMKWLVDHPSIRGGSTPGGGFRVTWTAVALTAATAKTIAGVAAGANNAPSWVELSVNGDATSGTILVEQVFGTNASNPPGTSSTSFTPLLVRGATQTMNSTCAVNWTAEPTVLTVVGRYRMPWPGGPFVMQLPLTREPNGVVTAATSGKLTGLRLTSSVAVTNCDGHAELEE